MKFRGRGVAKCDQELRIADGSLALPVGENHLLHFLSVYKHLGSVAAADGGTQPDARAKAASMNAAYSPIAVSIFGSPRLPASLKRLFQSSLCEARLLFNAHVMVPDVRYISVLKAAYMKVVRRRAGQMRFQKPLSDCDVRISMRAPSIDCLLIKARLRYLRRILV